MRKERKAYIQSCKISEVTTVALGGFKQKILIEAREEGLPVVLFLHGGPGFPPPFCIGARGLFPDITQKFTAVFWDQLGSGANNHKIDDSFAAAHFVAMTVDLIKYLKGRFSQPLYLFGISWGSLLAAYAAAEAPQLLAGGDDLVTAAREAREAVAAANNPLLTVTMLEGEGHIPTDRACRRIFAKLEQMNA